MTEPLVMPYKTHREIPELRGVGSLFTAEECDQWLRTQKNLIGWTYTINLYAIMRYNFTRIIAGRKPEFPVGEVAIRHAQNTHIKCYISKNEMLIGSYNLTEPTIQDCCVRLTKKLELNHMKQQFEFHWRTLK